MSHLVTIQSKLTDSNAVAAACARLNLPTPVNGKAKLFSSEVTGLLVQLPSWQYPVVIDTRSGEVKFDNFEGHWGKKENLDLFLQMYAVEKAKLEARKKGYTVTEQTINDGSIKLQIIEGAKS